MLHILRCALVAGLLVSCGDKPTAPSGIGRIVLEIKYSPGVAKSARTLVLDSMTAFLTSTGPEQVSLAKDLSLVGTVWEGDIEVAPGSYRVGVLGYKDGQVRWEGITGAEVRAGQTAVTQITLSFVAGNVDVVTGDTFIALLPGNQTMEFVWIEPGTFLMGSPSSEPARFDDENQHSVTITEGFYLGKYEITQGQWEAVMGTKPWRGQSSVRDNPAHPVVYISWTDVQAFIRRLNEASGRTIYRLPSEAEWEYAARAGTITRWSFGDNESQLGKYAWYRDNAWDVGLKWGQPVGTKLPNPWGLYDMHGNVWEWVQDWYWSGTSRVYRGGNFGNFAHSLRSAQRAKFSPSVRTSGIGARLLRIQ